MAQFSLKDAVNRINNPTLDGIFEYGMFNPNTLVFTPFDAYGYTDGTTPIDYNNLDLGKIVGWYKSNVGEYPHLSFEHIQGNANITPQPFPNQGVYIHPAVSWVQGVDASVGVRIHILKNSTFQILPGSTIEAADANCGDNINYRVRLNATDLIPNTIVSHGSGQQPITTGVLNLVAGDTVDIFVGLGNSGDNPFCDDSALQVLLDISPLIINKPVVRGLVSCSSTSITVDVSLQTSGTVTMYDMSTNSIVSSIPLVANGYNGYATFNNLNLTNGGSYDFVVSNVDQEDSEHSDELYIDAIDCCVIPTITTQPLPNVSACNVYIQNISVVAEGTPNLTYQWYKANGEIILGADMSTYAADITGEYYVIVTNNCGSVQSNISSVVFGYTPNIISGNILPNAVVGENYSHDIVFGANPSFAFDAVNLLVTLFNSDLSWLSHSYNNTTKTLTLSGVPTEIHSNANVLIVINNNGCTLELNYNINVESGCTNVTVELVDSSTVNICEGNQVVIESIVTGSLPVSYQWYLNNTVIEDEINSSINANSSGIYTLRVFNECSQATSNGKTVNINVSPTTNSINTSLVKKVNDNYHWEWSIVGTNPFTLSDIIKPNWLNISVINNNVIADGIPTSSDVGDFSISFNVINSCGNLQIEITNNKVLALTAPEIVNATHSVQPGISYTFNHPAPGNSSTCTPTIMEIITSDGNGLPAVGLYSVGDLQDFLYNVPANHVTSQYTYKLYGGDCMAESSIGTVSFLNGTKPLGQDYNVNLMQGDVYDLPFPAPSGGNCSPTNVVFTQLVPNAEVRVNGNPTTVALNVPIALAGLSIRYSALGSNEQVKYYYSGGDCTFVSDVYTVYFNVTATTTTSTTTSTTTTTTTTTTTVVPTTTSTTTIVPTTTTMVTITVVPPTPTTTTSTTTTVVPTTTSSTTTMFSAPIILQDDEYTAPIGSHIVGNLTTNNIGVPANGTYNVKPGTLSGDILANFSVNTNGIMNFKGSLGYVGSTTFIVELRINGHYVSEQSVTIHITPTTTTTTTKAICNSPNTGRVKVKTLMKVYANVRDGNGNYIPVLDAAGKIITKKNEVNKPDYIQPFVDHHLCPTCADVYTTSTTTRVQLNTTTIINTTVAPTTTIVPCVPNWNNTGVIICTNGFEYREQFDGCGNTRWQPTGNTCNYTTTTIAYTCPTIDWSNPTITCNNNGTTTATIRVTGNMGLLVEFFDPVTQTFKPATYSNNEFTFTVPSTGQPIYTHARIVNCNNMISGNVDSCNISTTTVPTTTVISNTTTRIPTTTIVGTTTRVPTTTIIGGTTTTRVSTTTIIGNTTTLIVPTTTTTTACVNPVLSAGVVGSDGVNTGSTHTYTVNNSGVATSYLWTVQHGTILSGQGTNSVSIQFNNFVGNNEVRVVVGNSCSSISTALQVLVTSAVTTTTAPGCTLEVRSFAVCGSYTGSGNLILRAESTYNQTYLDYPIDMEYQLETTTGTVVTAWTGSGFNNSVDFLVPNNTSYVVKVRKNGCIAQTNVTVNCVYTTVGCVPPSQVVFTNGNQSVQPSAQETYATASNGSGSNYQITNYVLSGGTISYGLNESVFGVNWGTSPGDHVLRTCWGCGSNVTCADRTVNIANVIVTTTAVPCYDFTTATISGDINVNDGDTKVYNVTHDGVGPFSYIWDLPMGNGTITAGQGSNSITVVWDVAEFSGNNGGRVRCRILGCSIYEITRSMDTNIYAETTTTTTTVVGCTGITNLEVTGESNPEENTTRSYSFTYSGDAHQSVSWSVVGGTINGSSTGQLVTVDWGTGTGSLTANVIDCNGSIVTNTMNINLSTTTTTTTTTVVECIPVTGFTATLNDTNPTVGQSVTLTVSNIIGSGPYTYEYSSSFDNGPGLGCPNGICGNTFNFIAESCVNGGAGTVTVTVYNCAGQSHTEIVPFNVAPNSPAAPVISYVGNSQRCDGDIIQLHVTGYSVYADQLIVRINGNAVESFAPTGNSTIINWNASGLPGYIDVVQSVCGAESGSSNSITISQNNNCA